MTIIALFLAAGILSYVFLVREKYGQQAPV